MPRRTRNVAFLQFDAKSFCAALTVVVLSSMLANDSIPRDGKGALMQVWKIAITSPTGTFDATLNFDPKLSPPAGEMRARNGSGPMSDLKLGPDTIEWATKIERPMPMKTWVQGQVRTMSGTVKFGIFASGTFTGILA